MQRYLSESRLLQAQRLKELAERAALSPTQVALAFCLRDPRVASVLVGARDSRQLDASLAAVGVVLVCRVPTELDQLFPLGAS